MAQLEPEMPVHVNYLKTVFNFKLWLLLLLHFFKSGSSWSSSYCVIRALLSMKGREEEAPEEGMWFSITVRPQGRPN